MEFIVYSDAISYQELFLLEMTYNSIPMDGCCIKCAVLNRCRAFTFENGVCEFKTKGGKLQNKSGAVKLAEKKKKMV